MLFFNICDKNGQCLKHLFSVGSKAIHCAATNKRFNCAAVKLAVLHARAEVENIGKIAVFAFFNNILDEIVAEIFNTEQAVIYDFSVGGKTFHRAIDIRRSKTQTEALALSNIACDLV